MSLVTLITCTGFRPEAFALCQKYVERQTYQGDIQWIIVHDNDGWAPVKCRNPNIKVTQLKGPKTWKPGYNTQRLNLDAALPFVEGDYVFIYEDDDHFSPSYIETFLTFLKHAPLVGIANNYYYNLKHSCYKEMGNYSHSSLCSSAFTKELLPLFDLAINSGEKYIDIELWRNAQHKLLIAELPLCIGIKGLPGRPGIGIGHYPQGFTTDYNMAKLISLIGEDDAKDYKPYYKDTKPLTAGQSAIVHSVKEAVSEELRGRTVSGRGSTLPNGPRPTSPIPSQIRR